MNLDDQREIIIGDPERFALRISLNADYAGAWLFGKFCYVVNGQDVGDFHRGTSLRDVYFQMHYVFIGKGKRFSRRFCEMAANSAFDNLFQALYGDGCSGENITATEENWIHHDLSVRSDLFCGVKIFQIDGNDGSRLIWKFSPFDSTVPTSEFVVPLGTTENAIEVFEEMVSAKLLQFQEYSRRS